MTYVIYGELPNYCDLPAEVIAAAGEEYCNAQIAIVEDRVNRTLSSRYTVPLNTPVDPVIKGWIARMTAPRILRKRGFNPDDTMVQDYREDAQRAEDELKAEASSDKNRFKLTPASAARKSPVYGKSETNPYNFHRVIEE